MTEQEVIDEFMRDWKYLSHSHARWTHPENLKLAAAARRLKLDEISRLTYVTTPQHNRTMVLRHVHIKMGYVDILPIGVVECSDGVKMHILLSADHYIMFFTTHFFQRYKERMAQGGVTMKDAVRTFFKRNPKIVPSSGAHAKFENSIQVACNDGVMLGNFRGYATIDEQEVRMLDIRTFLRKGDNISKSIQFVDNELRPKL